MGVRMMQWLLSPNKFSLQRTSELDIYGRKKTPVTQMQQPAFFAYPPRIAVHSVYFLFNSKFYRNISPMGAIIGVSPSVCA